MNKIIKFGEYAELNLDKLELKLFSKKIKLKEARIDEKYLEPFVGVDEPEEWIVIDGKKVCAKIKEKFYCNY